jgi:hypothetical protein
MFRRELVFRGVGVLVCLALLLSFQGTAPPGAQYDGDAFTFQQVRDGVYLAIGTGNLTLISNAAVIVTKTMS